MPTNSMKKIILASASPQRKKLMKLLGIPFSIRPSRAKEIHHPTKSCPALVKRNALLKAQEVANRTKEGIVIGADTLVILGNGEIIGKPRNLKEAKKRLKQLFRKPSYVYTGVAVIDAKTGKAVVDYEKTKVYMYPLTDKEIDRYYAHMSPLDKAGGFDIEGKGSHFIHRIEGCYFNVVGLPIAKVVQILKKFGIQLLCALFLVYLGGCTTEFNPATGKQETLLYSTEKEIRLGDSIARRFERTVKFVQDVAMNERVQRIFKKLVRVCDRKDLVYSVKIIDDDKINAVSLPGGYVYVYRGLVEKVQNDDQLACVLGHELGHITARHAIKRLQALYGYNFLQILALQAGGGQFAKGVELAFASIFTAYSQQDEFEADALGIKYARKAGFNPEAMAGFLERLKTLQEKDPLRPLSYFRTHPYLSQRIARANEETSGELNFRDYLNLTGE